MEEILQSNLFLLSGIATVTSIFPPSGPYNGNTQVVIRGTGFVNSGSTFCRFGDQVIRPQSVPDSTSIVCRAPAQRGNTAKVTVDVSINSVDFTNSGLFFEYQPNVQLKEIFPASGPVSGSTVTTIVGGPFVNVSALACRFGNTVISAVFHSSSELSCISPVSLAVGPVDVAVTVNGLDFSESTLQFFYERRLSILRIDPALGPQSGGSEISIVGQDFMQYRDFVGCRFGTNVVKGTVLSDSVIRCIAPAHHAESVQLGITYNGQQYTANYGDGEALIYQYYPDFVISSLEPNRGSVLGGTMALATLSGLDAIPSTSIVKCRFGSIQTEGFLALNRTKSSGPLHLLKCMSPSGKMPGPVSFSVSINGGKDFTKTDEGTVMNFNYTPPASISDIIPRIGPAYGGTYVTVSGSGFHTSQAAHCLFGDIKTSAIVANDTVLYCESPPLDLISDVRVRRPTAVGEGESPDLGNAVVSLRLVYGDIQASSSACGNGSEASATFFYYGDIKVLDISPKNGRETAPTAVTISGQNFYKSSSWTCRFGRTPPVQATWVSSQIITCIAPPHVPGFVQVAISINGKDYLDSTVPFTYRPIFTLTAITPNFGPTSGNTVIRVFGTGFANQTFHCLFGSIASPMPSTYVSPVEIWCRTPPQEGGEVALRVVLPGDDVDHQNVDSDIMFSYEDMAYIDSVAPMNGPATGNTVLNIMGSGFGKTAEWHCSFASNSHRILVNATVLSPTRLRCVTPAFPSAPATVSLSLMVHGQDFLRQSVQYTFHRPIRVKRVWPSLGWEAGGTTVTVIGSDFLPFKTLACRFGIYGVVPAKWITSETIQCVSPAVRSPQDTQISVTNNQIDFSPLTLRFSYYPKVVVTGISPNVGYVSGGTDVSVNGSGFSRAHNISCVFGMVFTPATFLSSSIVKCRSPAKSWRLQERVLAGISVNGADVSFGDDDSPESYFTYIQEPIVESIFPNFGLLRGGTLVKLFGSNLDSIAESSSASFQNTSTLSTAFCRFGTEVVPALVEESRHQISCLSPDIGATDATSVIVAVSTNGGQDFSSSGLLFLYKDQVELYDINPTIGVDSGGVLVTITGSGFRRTPFLACRFGPKRVPANYVSSRAITCVSPPYLPTMVRVTVTLNGAEYSEAMLPFKYIPTLSLFKAEPASVPRGSLAYITLSGGNFTNAAIGGLGLYCNFSGLIVEAAVMASDSLSCRIPKTLEEGLVHVGLSSGRADVAAGTSVAFTLFDPPLIKTIWPLHGPIEGSSEILIMGSFSQYLVLMRNGTSRSPLSCCFSYLNTVDKVENVYSPASYINDSYIRCPTPNMTEKALISSFKDDGGLGLQTEVLVLFDQTSAWDRNGRGLSYFFHAFPALESITPSVGDIGGGMVVNVRPVKDSHLIDSGDLRCRFGTVSPVPAFMVAGSIQCMVPPALVYGAVSVEISENGIDYSSSGLKFHYIPTPTIALLYPRSGPKAGSTILQIEGTGFTLVDRPCLRIANVVVPVTVWNSTFATALSPPFDVTDSQSSSTTFPVVFSNNGGSEWSAQRENITFTYYSQPHVAAIYPESGPLNLQTSIQFQLTSLPSEVLHSIFCKMTSDGWDSAAVTTSPAVVLSRNEEMGMYVVQCDLACGLEPSTVLMSLSANGQDFDTESASFFYCEAMPTVTSFAPAFGALLGGTDVVITGETFPRRKQLKCRFGSVVVKAKWVSSTQIKCSTSVNTSESPGLVELSLTTNGFHYTSFGSYEFVNPEELLMITPTSASQAGGSVISVTGKNFINATSLSCRFGETSTSLASFVSNSDIHCRVPSLLSPGPVVVAVSNNGKDFDSVAGANSPLILTIEAIPTVSEIMPSKGFRAAGITITVYGSGFHERLKKLSCQFSSSGGQSEFKSREQALYISDTQLQCTLSREPLANLSAMTVEVSVDGEHFTKSDTVFRFVSPVRVTSLVPASGPVLGGTVVHVIGSGFSEFENYDCRFGSAGLVRAAQVVLEGVVTCVAPSSLSMGFVDLTLLIDGSTISSGTSRFYFYEIPVINAITPPIGSPDGGVVVEIAGSNLVNHGDGLWCKFGDIIVGALADADGSDGSVLRCISPAANDEMFLNSFSSGIQISVSANGVDFSESSVTFQYSQSWNSVGIEPARGPSSGGTIVKISGSGWTSVSALWCRFGETDSGAVAAFLVSNTAVSCLTSPMEASPRSVRVYLSSDGTTFIDTGLAFEIFPEVRLNSVLPSKVPVTGSRALIIKGESFMDTPQLSCRFGNLQMVPALWISNSTLKCISPPSDVPGFLTLDVSINGKDFSANSLQFEYYPMASVNDLHPRLGPTSGGTLIIVTGTGLESASLCWFGDMASVVLKSGPNAITCPSPARLGMQPGSVSVALEFTSGERITVPQTFQYYKNPLIRNLRPLGGLSSGSTIVTVDLEALETLEALPLAPFCRFGPSSVAAISWNQSQIICSSPVLQGGKTLGSLNVVSLEVSWNGIDYTNQGVQYNYYPDVMVHSVQPSVIPVTGGVDVIISGTNFLRTNDLACGFGTSPRRSIPATYLSPTAIRCVTPAHPFQDNVEVSVTCNGADWSSSTLFVTYQMVKSLHSLWPKAISIEGNITISVGGSSFVNASNLEGVFFLADGREFGRVLAAYQNDSSITLKSPYIPEDVYLQNPSLDVKLYMNGQDFSANQSLSVLLVRSIYVNEVSPLVGGLAGGLSLRIDGMNFNATVEHQCVFSSPNGSAYSVATVLDSETIQCVTPPSPRCTKNHTGCAGPVVVKIYRPQDGAVSKEAPQFWYVDPISLEDIAPQWIPESGNINITLSGNNFTRLLAADYYCRIGSSFIKRVTWLNEQTLECEAPPNAAGTFEVSVSNNQIEWFGGLFLRYESELTLTSLTPFGGSINGGTVVNIIGKGFQNSSSTLQDREINLMPFCRFGSLEVMATVVSDSSMRCRAPTYSEPGIVYLTLVMRYPYTKKKVVYSGPSLPFMYQRSANLFAIEPKSGSARGGTVLQLAGNSFEDTGKILIKLWGTIYSLYWKESLENSIDHEIIIAIS